MSKKILILPLLGASLSFATWGYFPFKASDDGFTVKASHYITFGDEDVHNFNLNARYVLGSTLEIALMDLGNQFTDPSGLLDPVISVRLQATENSLFFVEGTLPIGADEHPEYIYAGVQQALVLSKHFAWSTEFGLKYTFSTTEEEKHSVYVSSREGYKSFTVENTSSTGPEVIIATEADFNTNPSLIWFVGTEFVTTVLESKYEYSYPVRVDSNYDYNYGGYTYDYAVQKEVDKAGDLFDIGLKVFGGFNIEIMDRTFIEEEFTMQLLGTGKYDYSSYAFKTSLKHSF